MVNLQHARHAVACSARGSPRGACAPGRARAELPGAASCRGRPHSSQAGCGGKRRRHQAPDAPGWAVLRPLAPPPPCPIAMKRPAAQRGNRPARPIRPSIVSGCFWRPPPSGSIASGRVTASRPVPTIIDAPTTASHTCGTVPSGAWPSVRPVPAPGATQQRVTHHGQIGYNGPHQRESTPLVGSALRQPRLSSRGSACAALQQGHKVARQGCGAFPVMARSGADLHAPLCWRLHDHADFRPAVASPVVDENQLITERREKLAALCFSRPPDPLSNGLQAQHHALRLAGRIRSALRTRPWSFAALRSRVAGSSASWARLLCSLSRRHWPHPAFRDRGWRRRSQLPSSSST